MVNSRYLVEPIEFIKKQTPDLKTVKSNVTERNDFRDCTHGLWRRS